MDIQYGLSTIKKLDTLPIGTWYPFDSPNHNPKDLLEVVKLRIDLSGDFIISSDYKYFKRIKQFNREAKNSQITYSIEWREDTGELNEKERNLPDPKFKRYTKKEWDQLTGRADK